MIIYILYKHIIIIIKCFKNELNSQFRARSGPIRSDAVIRSDPVNTRTAKRRYEEKLKDIGIENVEKG